MNFSSNDNLRGGFRSYASGIVLLLLGAWAADACGGVSEHSPPGSGDASSSSGGASGSSGGGASGSSSGGGTSACPSSPPASGTGCIAEGLWCQYGDDPDVACDTVASCQGARWTYSPTLASVCPTLAPGMGGCPSTPPPAGELCSSTAVCAYPSGLCGCGESDIVIELPDGGASDLSWICEQPAAGCPEPRPAIGSPCQNEGQACVYGTCAVLDSLVGLGCAGGTWTGGGFAGCAD